MKKAPPYGVADFVIFKIENREIHLMLFLTRLRHNKKAFNLFIKNKYESQESVMCILF